MTLKQAMIALAAGVLIVALSLADANAHARGGGGRGGGGGFGGRGGFGPGAGAFSSHAFRSYGAPYGSRLGAQSFHPRGAYRGHAAFSKGYPASRYSKAPYKASYKVTSTGVKNFSHLGSNTQLRQAALTHPNGFYHHNFNYGRDHHYWHDRWGRWWGYRWYGAVFWPYWFGDYYSCAFWPDGYCDTYWGYGPDALVGGAFWPYGEAAYDDGSAKGGVYSGDIYGPYRKPAQNAPD